MNKGFLVLYYFIYLNMLKIYLLERIPADGEWQANAYNITELGFYERLKWAQDKSQKLNEAEVDYEYTFENDNTIEWFTKAKMFPNKQWESNTQSFYVKNKRKADRFYRKFKYRITEIKVQGRVNKLKKKKRSYKPGKLVL